MSDDFRQVSDRLDRFESNVNSKLDILTQALIKLARIEEKLISMDKELKDSTDRGLRLSGDQAKARTSIAKEISDLKITTKETSDSMNTISRFFWLIMAALISTGIGIVATIMI